MALTKIDDPQLARELWMSGLLVNREGGEWGAYRFYAARLSYIEENWEEWMPDAYVLLEE